MLIQGLYTAALQDLTDRLRRLSPSYSTDVAEACLTGKWHRDLSFGVTPQELSFLGTDTMDDNGNFVQEPAVEARANGLALRFEEWLERFNPNSDQLRLLRMIGEQIKANAADVEQWETFRFVMPPFSSIGGLARMKQLFGGDEGLATMLRSMNTAVFDFDEADPKHSTADKG